jgi:hypothetical protein
MSIFSRFFGKQQANKPEFAAQKPADTVPKDSGDGWPNNASWCALKNGVSVESKDGPRYVECVDCGEIFLPGGRLAVCDPFVFLSPTDMPFIAVPKGRFPVRVTVADVSPNQDRTHLREAYASVIFAGEEESMRRTIPLVKDGEDPPLLSGDAFMGFAVDAGTACFVDESVVAGCMPDPSRWYEDLFENERDDCWFRRMDDPKHIRAGIANIALPLARNGENLVLFHSGWGDGVFPVIGSYSADGRLLAVHIDFFVVP